MSLSRILSLLGTSMCLACADAPVEWTGSVSTTSGSPVVSLTSAGAIVADTPLAALQGRLTPPSTACVGSLRLARAGAMLHAVWWSPRADSGARLLAARSTDDGATWNATVPVDTLDIGVGGCAREAPSIAADSASGYVHVAYALHAPEGKGLFFAHSMDNGVMYHAPVPVVYGDRLGRTSVAADGDVVAVAFEDPNSRSPRIGLALSRTMGHIFEHRLLPVSDENGRATHPLVAVHDRRLAVAWQERATSDGGVALRVRMGTIH